MIKIQPIEDEIEGRIAVLRRNADSSRVEADTLDAQAADLRAESARLHEHAYEYEKVLTFLAA